jgi:hypothetical protein
VRLSLAQSAAGKTADTRATLDRFLEIERHFPGYAQANLQPEIRTAFKTLLLAQVPPATILAIPSLAGLIETEEQKVARLPPADRRKTLEAAARREPGNVPVMVALSRDSLERRYEGRGPMGHEGLVAQPGDADALRLARARAARGECVDAKGLRRCRWRNGEAARPRCRQPRAEVRNFDAAGVAARIGEPAGPRRRGAAKSKLTAEQQQQRSSRGRTTQADGSRPLRLPRCAQKPAAPGRPACRPSRTRGEPPDGRVRKGGRGRRVLTAALKATRRTEPVCSFSRPRASTVHTRARWRRFRSSAPTDAEALLLYAQRTVRDGSDRGGAPTCSGDAEGLGHCRRAQQEDPGPSGATATSTVRD